MDDPSIATLPSMLKKRENIPILEATVLLFAVIRAPFENITNDSVLAKFPNSLGYAVVVVTAVAILLLLIINEVCVPLYHVR